MSLSLPMVPRLPEGRSYGVLARFKDPEAGGNQDAQRIAELGSGFEPQPDHRAVADPEHRQDRPRCRGERRVSQQVDGDHEGEGHAVQAHQADADQAHGIARRGTLGGRRFVHNGHLGVVAPRSCPDRRHQPGTGRAAQQRTADCSSP